MAKDEIVRQTSLRAANIYFGSQLDPFKNLPAVPIESIKAGCLDRLKKYSKLQCSDKPRCWYQSGLGPSLALSLC